MKLPLKDISGFFRVEPHGPYAKAAWAIVVLVCILLIIFGIWAFRIDFFQLRGQMDAPLASLLLVSCVTIALPVVALGIALQKSLQMTGMHLYGARVTEQGIELGTLKLSSNAAARSGSLQQNVRSLDAAGTWVTKNKIINRHLAIDILVRQPEQAKGQMRFEGMVIALDDQPTCQLLSESANENCSQHLAIMVNGVIHPIENPGMLKASELPTIVESVSEVLEACTSSPPPCCTLKLLSSHASQNNPLATGVLGAFTIGEKRLNNGKTMEDFFDRHTCGVIEKQLNDRKWRVVIDEEGAGR